MTHSMAQRHTGLSPLELPGWITALNWSAAVLLGVLFLVSGVWKITDVPGAAARMTEARVPESLSLFAAVTFGIVETLTGTLLLVPRFRRWGAILAGVLLTAFLVYFALNYTALRGADCSCFPWIKRVVGPGFFIGDGIMLLLAVVAGFWAKHPESLRSAILVLGAVVVFALVSYGVGVTRANAAQAPAAIRVDGKPYSLQSGRFFLFFFNPQCSHCLEAAKRLAQLHWNDTRIVAIPVEQPDYAAPFLEMTGLNAVVTRDFEALSKTFGYTGYPFGVTLKNGRRTATLTEFNETEPAATLKKMGYVR